MYQIYVMGVSIKLSASIVFNMLCQRRVLYSLINNRSFFCYNIFWWIVITLMTYLWATTRRNELYLIIKQLDYLTIISIPLTISAFQFYWEKTSSVRRNAREMPDNSVTFLAMGLVSFFINQYYVTFSSFKNSSTTIILLS